jgi:hypothetical protein
VALATLAELQLRLQGDVDLPAAQAALDDATGTIQAACGWPIVATTATVVLDSCGTRDLFLPTMWLTAVGPVTVNGASLVTGVDFWWYATGRLRAASGRWPYGARTVTVTFSHGYATPPPALRSLCLDLAAVTFRNPVGVRSYTVGAESVTYAGVGTPGPDLANDPRLGPYRLPAVA